MITYLITAAAEITPDDFAARVAAFKHLAEWTGDEWSADRREKFATRFVVDDSANDEEPPTPEFLPWSVCWDDREQNAMESTEVARFLTEKEAEDFAGCENSRLMREYIRNDTNFTILHLPDDITPSIGAIRQGRYPLSRTAQCDLSRQGITVEALANWSAQGVTDTWPNQYEILTTLIDLIPDLINAFTEESVESLTTANNDAATLLAEIMRDEVNAQDEAEKWLRDYAPQHLFPATESTPK